MPTRQDGDVSNMAHLFPIHQSTRRRPLTSRAGIPAFLAYLNSARHMIIFLRVSAEAFFFSRVSAKKKFCVFCVCVFLVFFGVLGGVFVLFVFLCCFSRVCAKNCFGLFFALSQAKPGIPALLTRRFAPYQLLSHLRHEYWGGMSGSWDANSLVKLWR